MWPQLLDPNCRGSGIAPEDLTQTDGDNNKALRGVEGGGWENNARAAPGRSRLPPLWRLRPHQGKKQAKLHPVIMGTSARGLERKCDPHKRKTFNPVVRLQEGPCKQMANPPCAESLGFGPKPSIPIEKVSMEEGGVKGLRLTRLSSCGGAAC